MDKYDSFEELKQHETEGIDYEILYRPGTSGIAIMAPHGGGIEPGTAIIADGIAGGEHTFYAFKGLKKRGNRVLHISSSRFDEPIALKIAKEVAVVITIHGCRGEEETVYIGGRHAELSELIRDRMMKSGFQAEFVIQPGLYGRHPNNICNRGHEREGTQLELPLGLRKKMITNLWRRSIREKTPTFHRFVKTMQDVLR